MHMQDYVIVVNASDEELGHEEKLRAHRTPVLHRAFSVFVLDHRGAMLLQRRAAGKYHSAGLWSNACCGHPRPGESVAAAAERRLQEEMGIRCALLPAGTVSYSLDVGGGLREDEFNHVFAGVFTGDAQPDPAEVSGWRWMAPGALRAVQQGRSGPADPVVCDGVRSLQRWLEGGPAAVPAAVREAWRARA
jgi:isopentenyl-diphosphate delta-isomerase